MARYAVLLDGNYGGGIDDVHAFGPFTEREAESFTVNLPNEAPRHRVVPLLPWDEELVQEICDGKVVTLPLTADELAAYGDSQERG